MAGRDGGVILNVGLVAKRAGPRGRLGNLPHAFQSLQTGFLSFFCSIGRLLTFAFPNPFSAGRLISDVR
jgi:hypothetical protein